MDKTNVEKPLYANFDSPRKFLAIQSIIAKRLIEHPNAICAYSGGSDSDIMIDLIERARELFELPPVHYVFFNTGLEMKATKDHVKEVEKKYGVEIEEARPSIGIVQAARKYGIPIFSKLLSEGFERWQRKDVPISIIHEFNEAEDQAGKRAELSARFPKCETVINFLCSCDRSGKPIPHAQFTMASEKYLSDFVEQCPPDFNISAKCCYYCKKQIAHQIQKNYEMIITGERMAEGGARSMKSHGGCFNEASDGQFRLRPLFYVSDSDKAWYKEYYGIKYSDAYEVYGLTRTGCCGCPISYKAVDDLEKIRKYEPNVVKAAWNIFGKSYTYRRMYNEYKAMRMANHDLDIKDDNVEEVK